MSNLEKVTMPTNMTLIFDVDVPVVRCNNCQTNIAFTKHAEPEQVLTALRLHACPPQIRENKLLVVKKKGGI